MKSSLPNAKHSAPFYLALIVSMALLIFPCDTDAELLCGDANNDGLMNVMDTRYLYHYVFEGGPPPSFPEAADVNCDGGENIGDANMIWTSLLLGDRLVTCCFTAENDQSGIISHAHIMQLSEANSGDLEKTLYGDFIDVDLVHEGGTDPVETILLGGRYQFRVWVANSQPVFGMSIVSKIQFGDAVDWSWLPAPGPGWVGIPFVDYETGGRLNNAFDVSGIIVRGDDRNGDAICIGGISLNWGLSPGPAEHMFSFHFQIDSLHDTGDSTICFDSSLFGPYDTDLVFAYQDGSGIYPDVLWPAEGKCYTVELPSCGDANSDGGVNVGDAVYLINYVFNDGSPPVPYCAGDANGDAMSNVGDAVYNINYVFKGGASPADGCCD